MLRFEVSDLGLNQFSLQLIFLMFHEVSDVKMSSKNFKELEIVFS